MKQDRILKIISGISNIPVEKLKEMESEPQLWDSMTHIEIVIEIESELNIKFSKDEIIEMTTVEKILEITERKSGK